MIHALLTKKDVYLRKLRRRRLRWRYDNTRRVTGSRKLCVLIGPESTGTRLFTAAISQHPLIMGTPEASGHLDILDDVWRDVDDSKLRQAAAGFPNLGDAHCVLTRRSMPHTREFGDPAIFMEFADLDGMHRLSRRLKLELVLLITSRSPIPNLTSWTRSRMSVWRQYDRAESQYFATYRYLLDFLNRSKVPFYFLSLEGLLLDREAYVDAVFQLLHLPTYPVNLDLKSDVNSKQYEWYGAQDHEKSAPSDRIGS